MWRHKDAAALAEALWGLFHSSVMLKVRLYVVRLVWSLSLLLRSTHLLYVLQGDGVTLERLMMWGPIAQQGRSAFLARTDPMGFVYFVAGNLHLSDTQRVELLLEPNFAMRLRYYKPYRCVVQ
jgi:hypothetical protein